MIRARRSFWRLLFTTSLMVGVTWVPTWAQTAAAPVLKAAFLLNFARFSEWPDLPPGSPLVLCVFGDDRVADALSSAVRGQNINAHGLEVSKMSAGEPTHCQLLFVAASEIRARTQLLESARALPILTVSDGGGFSESTGMVELFVEAGRMRFAINVDAVRRSRLRLSSRMLAIAKVVRDKRVH